MKPELPITVLMIALFAWGMPTMLLATSGATAQPSAPRFAIYRVEWPAASGMSSSDADTGGSTRLNLGVTQERAMAMAIRREPPILTEKDIVAYCWRTQRITVTEDGAARWNASSGWNTPLTGLPLLVVADGEPRYCAMLWNPVSSLSCELPPFWCHAIDDRLVVGGRRVNAAGDTIYGACYDAKAKSVLKDLGKLVEDCAE